MDHLIFGIHIRDRIKNAAKVQEVLTQYGCFIKTRIGLHDTASDSCSPSGLILLELDGEEKKCGELADKLSAIESVEIRQIRFSHT